MPQVVGQDDGTLGAAAFGVKGESQSAGGWGVVGIISPVFEPPDFLAKTLHIPDNPNAGMLAGVAGISKDLGPTPPLQVAGVIGYSDTASGVHGKSDTGYGAIGQGGDIGVYAHNLTANGNDVYLATRGLAGDFHGDVFVTGSVTVTGDVILTGADFAEEFDVAQAAEMEPGTVMVLDHDGMLHQSQRAYDKTVAGVISGAGDLRPGMILDRRQPTGNRMPVALVGKVYCKVDAECAPIDVGDLLTTSSTPGHAMKANDPMQAFGSVIGKALRPLKLGRGMIPILIALQ